MRRVLIAAIGTGVAGCPDPASTTDAGPSAAIDIFEGEGVTWSWGTPACAARLEAPGEPPVQTSVVWRDVEGRIVAGESCVGADCRRTSRRGFDRDGRVVIDDGDSGTRRWTYDTRGRIATEHARYADGDAWVTYHRDADDRLLDVTTDPVGGGTAFVQRYTRDIVGRVIGYHAEGASGVVSDETYTRDGAGHPVTARILGFRDSTPRYLNVVFEWLGDRYSHVHAIEDDAAWDLDSYYTWDANGQMVAISEDDVTLGHVDTLELDRSALGITRVRETGRDGAASWTLQYDRTPGRVVKTLDVFGRPPQHQEQTLVDTCPTDPPAEPVWSSSFEPAWESPWLPYDPDAPS
jgi:hypothetical protein